MDDMIFKIIRVILEIIILGILIYGIIMKNS